MRAFQTGPGIAIAAAAVLALGVGAKLFPVVLAPLLAACAARHAGWRTAVVTMLAFLVIVVLIVGPMAPPLMQNDTEDLETAAESGEEPKTHVGDGDPSLGLQTFLSRWEMNDFIFLLLIENLKPADVIPNQTAWFSVTPESFREKTISLVPTRRNDDRWQDSFYVARGATAFVFLLLAGWFTWRAFRSSDRFAWLEYSFLTLAWFWLLCPTQNPWYWTWVLPLLPFARSRAWLAMSGLVLVYYLRFWLGYHFPDRLVLGTGYHGWAFFDLVVTWVEYAPWLVCLTVGYLCSNWRRKGEGSSN